MKKSPIFVKHVLSGDEANLYPSCCLKHAYFKPKCYKLHNFQSVLVSSQKTVQTRLRIFLQTRIIVDGVKFSSHHSGSHF